MRQSQASAKTPRRRSSFASPRRRTLVSWYLLAAIVSLAAGSSADHSGEPVPGVSWRRLEFQASKLMVKARAHVELSQHDAAQARAELMDRQGQGALAPQDSRVLALEVGSSFLGRHSKASIWLDPVDNAALQREQVETGKRQRVKTYRFCDGSVYSKRVTPRDDSEKSLAPDRWTHVLEEQLAHDKDQTVIDPAALFYILSVADPKAYAGGQTVSLFSKGKIHSVALRFEAEEELDVDFELLPSVEPSIGDTSAGPTTVDERVQALRYTLRPGDEADALELLGLEGDLELWIEAERRIPVLVTGKVSPVGRVAVKLQRAWLAR